VVAHTENDAISSFFNDKVIAIDVPIRNRDYIPEGLLIEDDKYFCMGGEGTIKELY
jgi:hypothetical protein